MNPRLNPDEARKLLGGYATGTLTDSERETLMSAALEDQSLFDALAEEDELRELLQMPGAKTRLLAATREQPSAYWFGIPWLTRPRALSFGGLAAVVAVTVAFLAQKPEVQSQRPAPVSEIAQAPAAKQTEPAVTKDQPPAASGTRAPKVVQPAKTAPAGTSRQGPAEKAKKMSVAETSNEVVRDEKDKLARDRDRVRRVADGRRDAAPAEPESKKTESAPPPPASRTPPVVDVPSPKPVAPPAPTAGAPPVPNPGIRSGLAPTQQQQRPTPSQSQQAPAVRSAQQPEATIRRAESPGSAKSASGGGGTATPSAAEQQHSKEASQDSVASGRLRKAAPALAAQNTAASITLRYKLDRPAGDAPTELTVETSIGFVYILHRTRSGWDTVASGSGPHALTDLGEFAVVASRVELPNPAIAIHRTPASRIVVSSSGDGFTSISSPEASVATTLRVRAR